MSKNATRRAKRRYRWRPLLPRLGANEIRSDLHDHCSAARESRVVGNKHIQAVSEKHLAFEENPSPQGCKKLHGRNGWRIRVGDYPIRYEIDTQ